MKSALSGGLRPWIPTFSVGLFLLFSWGVILAEEGEETVAEEIPPMEITLPPADSIDFGPTPMASLPEGHAKSFHIPAPRGLIVSRDGEPLAINEVKFRLVLQLPLLADSAEAAIPAFMELDEAIEIHLLRIK